jgi:hypothetical protein
MQGLRNTTNTLNNIVGPLAEIQTWDLPNMNDCYLFDKVRKLGFTAWILCSLHHLKVVP